MRRMILIAHDTKMKDLAAWVRSKRSDLSGVELFATRPTGEEILSNSSSYAANGPKLNAL